MAKPTLKTSVIKGVEIPEVLLFPIEGGFGASVVVRAKDANEAVQYEKRIRVDLDAEGVGYAQQLLTKLQDLAVPLL